jgi:hypothetical protein
MGGQHQDTEYTSQEDSSRGPRGDSNVSQPHLLKLNTLARLMQSSKSSQLLSFCWNSAYPSSTRLSSCTQTIPHHSPLPTDLRHALKSGHIDAAMHFQREKVETGLVNIIHVTSQDNAADGFTKPLNGVKFARFRELLRIH